MDVKAGQVYKAFVIYVYLCVSWHLAELKDFHVQITSIPDANTKSLRQVFSEDRLKQRTRDLV